MNEYIKREDVLNTVIDFANDICKSKILKALLRNKLEEMNDKLLFLPVKYIPGNRHWDFVINEERVGYWEGKLTSLYYNGYKCSNCGHGGGKSIPREYGTMTEEEAKVFFGDMNYRFCPNCGAGMVNGK